MRVVRVIGGLEPSMGGPTETALNSITAMRREGFCSLVLFPSATANRAGICRRLADAQVPYQCFALSGHGGRHARRWGISVGLIRRLMSVAREHDLVHAHGSWTLTSVAALLIAKGARRPFVLTPHESLTDFDVWRSPLPRRLAKRVLRRVYLTLADALVVASDLEAETSAPPRRRDKVAVVPHPVIDERRTRSSHRSALGDALIVGFLGRFDEKKNVDKLVEGLARATLKLELHLRIAGDGNYPSADDIAFRAGELGIDDHVELLGWLSVSERREFFASLDLLALPSDFESFGMAAAEAIAAGVPVLVSATTGIAELVRRCGCGLVIEANADAIAAALDLLASDRTRVSRYAAATAEAGDELSAHAHARAMTAVYRRSLDLIPTRTVAAGGK